jgi:hypothetical protein
VNLLKSICPCRPSPASGKAEAEAAARRELDRVRSQWPTVRQYVAALTAHRERNHFAESISTIFRGGNA